MKKKDESEFFLTGYVLLSDELKWRLVFKRWSSREFWPQWCAARWQHQDDFDRFDDALAEKLLKCDLNGGIFKYCSNQDIDHWLDVPFNLKHSNLKVGVFDQDYCSLVKPTVELDPPRPDKTAQVTLIETNSSNQRYLHFNMTSYDFWEDDCK